MKKLVLSIFILTCVGFIGYAYFYFYLPRTRAQVITQKIQSLNRLETAVVISDAIVEEDDKTGNMIRDALFGDAILVVARGEVIAGIDFSKLSAQNIQIKEPEVTIILPPSEIFSSRLDTAKTIVFDRKTGILTKGDPQLETKARIKGEAAIRESACNAHILDVANENAQKNISSLASLAGIARIRVVTQSNTCK